MAAGSTKVINGIKTVDFHGKPYVEVSERLRIVHESTKEFQVLESQPIQIADRLIWRVVITVDNKQYVGNAEAKLTNARAGSPDATNPIECAETSALGRALAFAGLGTIESVASYDEVARGKPYEGQHVQADSEASQKQSEPLLDLIGKAKNRAKALGAAHNKEEWEAFLQEATGEPLKDQDITLALIARVNGKLTQIERDRKLVAQAS